MTETPMITCDDRGLYIDVSTRTFKSSSDDPNKLQHDALVYVNDRKTSPSCSVLVASNDTLDATYRQVFLDFYELLNWYNFSAKFLANFVFLLSCELD